MAGRTSVEGAARRVARREPRRGDGVRFTTAGRLRETGFIVARDPVPMFPEHVLVKFQGLWDDGVAKRCDECFDTPTSADHD